STSTSLLILPKNSTPSTVSSGSISVVRYRSNAVPGATTRTSPVSTVGLCGPLRTVWIMVLRSTGDPLPSVGGSADKTASGALALRLSTRPQAHRERMTGKGTRTTPERLAKRGPHGHLPFSVAEASTGCHPL